MTDSALEFVQFELEVANQDARDIAEIVIQYGGLDYDSSFRISGMGGLGVVEIIGNSKVIDARVREVSLDPPKFQVDIGSRHAEYVELIEQEVRKRLNLSSDA